MPDFSAFMRSDDYDDKLLDTNNVADGVAFMIDRKAVSISLVRNRVVQTAQRVRFDPINSATVGNESSSDTGESTSYDAILIGTKGHSTISDFDVKRGDEFVHNSIWYEVITVEDYQPGKIEAKVKARE